VSGDAVQATETPTGEALVEEVKEKYGKIARERGGCCGPAPSASLCCGGGEPVSVGLGYRTKDLSAVPEGADLGLGCGAPLEELQPAPGETVLDLGSGPGLDAFLAAKAVGPRGRVIGVDMTPAMIERARRDAAAGGYSNVEFREGRLETLPLETASIDAITSNCVINLVPDKAAVFGEIARVLRPGGRVVIADIVLDARLPAAVERDLAAYVGCVAGAAQRTDYLAMLERAGLTEIEVLRDRDASSLAADSPEGRELIERTGVRLEEVAGKIRSITVRARKPA
jgi:arsenite methyltransferase